MSEQNGSGRPIEDQRSRNLLYPEFKCSGGDVPPYGVVEFTAVEEVSRGGLRYTARNPRDSGEDVVQWWLNGPVQVKANQPGTAQRLGILQARIAKPTMDGNLAFGDWLVPDDENEFTLKRTNVPPAGSAFHYLGSWREQASQTIGHGLVVYQTVQVSIIQGKLTSILEAADPDDGWLDKPKTAEARVVRRMSSTDGEAEVLDETFTISNRTNVEIAKDTYFGAQRALHEWQIVYIGCP